jgi:hypothetical protein
VAEGPQGSSFFLASPSFSAALPRSTLATKNALSSSRRARENIFTLLHIFLASEKNKRILHFADSLRVNG